MLFLPALEARVEQRLLDTEDSVHGVYMNDPRLAEVAPENTVEIGKRRDSGHKHQQLLEEDRPPTKRESQASNEASPEFLQPAKAADLLTLSDEGTDADLVQQSLSGVGLLCTGVQSYMHRNSARRDEPDNRRSYPEEVPLRVSGSCRSDRFA